MKVLKTIVFLDRTIITSLCAAAMNFDLSTTLFVNPDPLARIENCDLSTVETVFYIKLDGYTQIEEMIEKFIEEYEIQCDFKIITFDIKTLRLAYGNLLNNDKKIIIGQETFNIKISHHDPNYKFEGMLQLMREVYNIKSGKDSKPIYVDDKGQLTTVFYRIGDIVATRSIYIAVIVEIWMGILDDPDYAVNVTNTTQKYEYIISEVIRRHY